MKILNQGQMQWVDHQTMLDQHISSTELMERAVHELYKCIKGFSWFDPLLPIYVFAGSGNNGGDGLGLARLLGDEGVEIKVFYCDYSTPSTENMHMRKHLPHRKYLTEYNIKGVDDLPEFEPGGLIIDAIFGSGINRPIEGLWKKVVVHINSKTNNRIISVDIPSGLHPDTPMPNAICVHADITLTIGQPKYTFFFPELSEVVGKWYLIDIKLSQQAIQKCNAHIYCIDRSYIRANTNLFRQKYSHKGTYGHALLVNGSYGKMGAAILAARSCIRSGVGLLTCHVPRIGYQIMQISVPESMVSVDQHDYYFHSSLDVSIYDAVGVGSGIDNRKGVCEALFHIIKNVKVPLVLDADALNILAQHNDWLKKLPVGTILTPHPGEFKRLFGPWNNDDEKLEHQMKLSHQYGIYIVLKGANSSISCPDGELYFNSTGNPGMATAGSGDTLTGMITALCAQGLEPKKAAILGVYIHGLAGDIAVKESSQISMISSDITEHLGEAFYETFQI